jgi:hypothetical protein
MYLSSYVHELADEGAINSSFLSPIMTAIMELQKAISELQKLRRTSIPFVYQPAPLLLPCDTIASEHY